MLKTRRPTLLKRKSGWKASRLEHWLVAAPGSVHRKTCPVTKYSIEPLLPQLRCPRLRRLSSALVKQYARCLNLKRKLNNNGRSNKSEAPNPTGRVTAMHSNNFTSGVCIRKVLAYLISNLKKIHHSDTNIQHFPCNLPNCLFVQVFQKWYRW